MNGVSMTMTNAKTVTFHDLLIIGFFEDIHI